MSEYGVSIPLIAEEYLLSMEKQARTGILVAIDKTLAGILAVSDPLKREAAVVIEGLKKMGVHPIMVTGDNWTTARAVAKEVGTACLCSFNVDLFQLRTVKKM